MKGTMRREGNEKEGIKGQEKRGRKRV